PIAILYNLPAPAPLRFNQISDAFGYRRLRVGVCSGADQGCGCLTGTLRHFIDLLGEAIPLGPAVTHGEQKLFDDVARPVDLHRNEAPVLLNSEVDAIRHLRRQQTYAPRE